MFTPESLISGEAISNVKEDFRNALRIEQYRLGDEAVYIPAGLKWNYIPRRCIKQAAPSHRTVSAGHCVTVEVRTPSLDISTPAGNFELHLEKQASLDKIIDILGI